MPDQVNHPDHYQSCSPLTRHILIGRFGEGCKEWLDGECLDFIEDMNLNFHLGNAIKYLWRVDKKNNPVEDLQKALFYLNRQSANAYLKEKNEINKLIEQAQTTASLKEKIAKLENAIHQCTGDRVKRFFE